MNKYIIVLIIFFISILIMIKMVNIGNNQHPDLFEHKDTFFWIGT